MGISSYFPLIKSKKTHSLTRRQVVGIIIGVAAYAIAQTAWTALEKRQFAEALTSAAAEANKQMKGKYIDAVTVFKEARYTPPNILKFSYKITSVEAARSLKMGVMPAQRVLLLKNYCTEMRSLVNAGARVEYKYYENFIPIGSILLSPRDCPK